MTDWKIDKMVGFDFAVTLGPVQGRYLLIFIVCS